MIHNMQTALDFDAPTTQRKTVSTPDDEVVKALSISGRTAIARAGVSAPLKVILSQQLISKGSVLHFGKGRSHYDSDALREAGGNVVDYDYVHHPEIDVLRQTYNTVYAGYVVNTLPPKARQYTWSQIAACTQGIAFVAARTDKIAGTPSEDGVITSIGTFQKQYQRGELAQEAARHFDYVVPIKGKSGFAIVACSHTMFTL